MNSLSHSKRYLPHELTTKYYAVCLYRQVKDVQFVCRRYKISKASLMRWNKLFDGTKESLLPKSHTPHTKHPNAHTEQELKWIQDLHRRNPNISVCELYGKLRINKGYARHPGSLYRIYRKLGYSGKVPSTKKKSRHLGKYDTPAMLGIKWQMDVKYVPAACYVGNVPEKFYQYTMIDEASRERFIYPYVEHSSYTTVDFVKRAITYFGYKPLEIQTDNGSEFTYLQKTQRTHLFDSFCLKEGINHKLIRPRTPWHNGKVERSHRNDQERFYNFLSFYSYEDLKLQMKRYLNRSNSIPMAVLCWKTPLEKRKELFEKQSQHIVAN
ncbi:MAG TPA: transposase family protein [Mogibacterium sp.]|nr:transposase family protein [Mogibacterium sp.]